MPMDFIEASKIAGVRPDQMRRWLDRPSVVALIRAERKAWRAAICAGNESALKRIRDADDGNQMAQVQAIKTLEAIDAEQINQTRGSVTQPGLIIQIVGGPAPSPMVDVTPPPAMPRQIEHEPEPPPTEHGEFISIEEVRGEQAPPREPDWPPEPEAAPLPREPRTLDEWKERILSGVAPLAPPGMAAAPKQPYDPGYQPPRGRQSPLSRRWRARRGEE
jgi:hypothetical protein